MSLDVRALHRSAAAAMLGLALLAAMLALVFRQVGVVWPALGVAAALAAVAITRAPAWGVLLMFTLWFTKPAPLGGPALVSVVQMGILLLLLAPLVMIVVRERDLWVVRVPQLQILVAIGLLFVLSTWWADFFGTDVIFPEADQTGRMLHVTLARLVFLTLFLVFFDTAPRIRLAVWVVVGLIAVAAATAALGLVTGEVVRARAAFGVAENSNRLGFVCLFALSLVWFHRAYAGSRSMLTLPLLVLLPVVALGTGSRSTLMATGLLAVFIVRDQKTWSPRRRMQCFLLIACVVLVAVVVVSQVQLLRATSFDPVLTAPGGKSLINRLMVVTQAAEIGLANPVLGIGIGNFAATQRTLYGLAARPHNSYVWALAEGGVGTLALYLLLFATTYRMLRALEARGPDDLTWLAKALRVNLILFLLYSAVADLWLSEFLYLQVGLAAAMAYRWRRASARAVPTRATTESVAWNG